jgi:hypothetical protein
MRLERQIYLGRQAVRNAQQGLSGRGSKNPLPPTSAGHQSSVIGAIRSLAESDDDDFDTRTLDAPEGWAAPVQPLEVSPPSPNNASFLSRLRTQSFPGFTSPIRQKGRLFLREGKAEGQPETSGSSDSSSAEDQLRPAYHPIALRSRTDVRQIFTRAGRGDGSDGDQEDEEL